MVQRNALNVNWIIGIYQKVDQWVRPYRYDAVKPLPKQQRQQVHLSRKLRKKGVAGIYVRKTEKPLDELTALQYVMTADYDRAAYWHDQTRHQIAVRFAKNSYRRYPGRDDKQRKKLHPLLFPKNAVFDRTHVIPIGYHGSEKDPRLVVGWNSRLNRNDLNEFEQTVKKLNQKQEILWFVDIEKQPNNTAVWNSYIWHRTGQLEMQITIGDDEIFEWR